MDRREFISVLLTVTASGCAAPFPVPVAEKPAPSMVVEEPIAPSQTKSYSTKKPTRIVRVAYHEHVCRRSRCGRSWSHPDGSRYAGAHSCPSCGREQYQQSRSWVSELEVPA